MTDTLEGLGPSGAELEELLDTALRAAAAGAQVLSQRDDSAFRATTKSSAGDWVTAFDVAAEKAVLRVLHDIEAEAGRTRTIRWGPRTLDLDLIQYGDPAADTDITSTAERLTLPHPRAHERGFVLVPWLDADPGASLRVGDEVSPVGSLLESVDTSGVRAAAAFDPVDEHDGSGSCGCAGC